MKCYLIAKKLSHSFSKPIHNALADYSYEYKELEENELKALASLRERIERTPVEQRGNLLEIYDFYEKSAEIVSDILRSLGK